MALCPIRKLPTELQNKCTLRNSGTKCYFIHANKKDSHFNVDILTPSKRQPPIFYSDLLELLPVPPVPPEHRLFLLSLLLFALLWIDRVVSHFPKRPDVAKSMNTS